MYSNMDQNCYPKWDFAADFDDCTEDPSNDSSPTTFTSSSLNHLIDEPLLAGCSSSSAVSHFDDEDKNGSMVSVSGPTSYQELSTKRRHSLIEKERRKKINSYIVQLSSMIPSCNSQKLDKITILQKTVQHIKSLQGSSNMYCKMNRPAFLADEEMKHLMKMEGDLSQPHIALEASHKSLTQILACLRNRGGLNSNGSFLFVIGCQGGKFLHVSEALVKALGMKQGDLFGQSIFDILHNKDVAKVKEQLSSQHDAIKDSNSVTVGIGSGSWRSFYCRLKHQYDDSSPSVHFPDLQSYHQGAEEERRHLPSDPISDFITIHCKGFIKSLGSMQNDSVRDEANQNCLVVIAHIVKPLIPLSPFERCHCFDFRLEADGKFIAVDQNMTKVLGYLPQELSGTSVFELYHQDDLHRMIEVHQSVLNTNNHIPSPIYRCQKKDGSYIAMQSDMTRFMNPRTKLIDSIMCHSTVLNSVEYSVEKEKKNSSEIPLKIITGAEERTIGSYLSSHEATANKARSRESADNLLTPPRKRLNSEISLVTSPSKRGYFASLPSAALGTSDNKDVSPYFGNSPSVLQNSWYPTPESSPVVKRSVSRSPSTNLGTTNCPSLKNGLRHPNLPNNGNTFCDSSLSPSWNNEQEYTPGSESEETGSVNSKNVSRHDDLYSTYNTCESSAMACVLSLLEDDIGLGEINMSDFSWSL